MSKTTDKLLSLLSEATEQDLADLDSQIETAEKAAAEQARLALQKIVGLRKLRNIVARQLGKLPPHPNKGRPKAARSAAASGSNGTANGRVLPGNDRRMKVAQFIAREGPQRTTAISTATDIPMGSMGDVMTHGWSEKDGQEWNLTPNGWTAVKELATK